jgi:glycosyltransferase involved in cell wall biosynthesis
MHLLVLTQNNIAPARYGGALRVDALIRGLQARGHRVSVIRFVSPGEPPSVEGSAGLSVLDVQTPAGYPTPPVAAAYHLLGNVAVRHAIKINRAAPVSLVQSDVPWAALTGHRIARRLGVRHVLMSMNCETTLARQFSHDSFARKLPLVGGLLAGLNLEVLRRAEKFSVETADLTATPSSGDISEMASVGIQPRRAVLVPNGTAVRPRPEARAEVRRGLGVGDDEPVALFVGRMDYPPNLEAAGAICNVIAPGCPQVRFLLVGSNPQRMQTPPNVTIVGQVDSVEPYLSAADVSLVPLSRGSGTRIKILDAWAAGLPVISTSIGASGLTYLNRTNILIEDDLRRFPGRIAGLLESSQLQLTLKEGALAAAASYAWDSIAGEYEEALRVLASETGRREAAVTWQAGAPVEVAR